MSNRLFAFLGTSCLALILLSPTVAVAGGPNRNKIAKFLVSASPQQLEAQVKKWKADDKCAALLEAVRSRNAKLVGSLLALGVNPNSQLPTEIMVKKGEAHETRTSDALRVTYIKPIYKKDPRGETPLAAAVLAGNAEIVTLLLEKGALPSQKLYVEDKLVDCFSLTKGNPLILKLLQR